MTEMMFPKQKTKKKRKKHRKSIIPQREGECYLCARLHGDHSYHRDLHCHHIFGAANRNHSEEYGLTVNLCISHHEYGPEAVHTNSEIAQYLHEIGQAAFEKTYPELEFTGIFGKNYR